MFDSHWGSCNAAILFQDGRWRMSVPRRFCLFSQLVGYTVEGVIILESVCWHSRLVTVPIVHSRMVGGRIKMTKTHLTLKLDL